MIDLPERIVANRNFLVITLKKTSPDFCCIDSRAFYGTLPVQIAIEISTFDASEKHLQSALVQILMAKLTCDARMKIDASAML